MEFLAELWMPIVVSAVFVWIASFITHMLVPIHKGEWTGLADEENVTSALAAVPPGQYMFPWAEMKDMRSPEHLAKVNRGPNGYVVLWGKPVAFGRNLVLMLLFYLVVGVFVAYVAWHGLGSGAHRYLQVFQVAGAAAFLVHGLGHMPHMIWFGNNPRQPWTYMLDGIIYALVTAGVFGWLWPK
jgi:hypothetical protein